MTIIRRIDVVLMVVVILLWLMDVINVWMMALLLVVGLVVLAFAQNRLHQLRSR